MAKTYLRCARRECNKLLTIEQKDKGECKCGGQKFRGVEPTAKFSLVEKAQMSMGLIHWVDTSIPGVDPDVLNLDNDKYWERVKTEIGQVKMEQRREAAIRRLANG